MCWYCDPDVSAASKGQARAGGQRKVLPAETADPVFSTVELRRAFRATVARALLRGELSPELASIALRACECAAKDAEGQNGGKPTSRPVVVEMQRA